MNPKLIQALLITFLLLAGEVWAKSLSFPMTKPYLKADVVLVSLSDDASVPFNKNAGPVTLSLDSEKDPTGLLLVDKGWLVVKKNGYFSSGESKEKTSQVSLVINVSQDQKDQLAKSPLSQNKTSRKDILSATVFILYLKKSGPAQYSIQNLRQESVTEVCSFLTSLPSPTAPLIRKKYVMTTKLLKPQVRFFDAKLFDSLAWNYACDLLTVQGTITLQDFKDIGIEATWDKGGTSLDAILDTDGRGHYSDDLFLEQKDGEVILTHSVMYATPKPEQTQYARRIFPNAKLLSLFTPTPTPPASLDWAKAQQTIPFPQRQDQAALVFQNKMWVIGGYVEPGRKDGWLNDVWSSGDGSIWTKMTGPDSFSARAHHSTLVYDHRIWIFGGAHQNTFYNDAWSSPDGIHWTKAASTAPYAGCSDQASVVFQGKMWILGGVGGKDRQDEIWTSTDGASWTKVEPQTPFSKSTPFYGLTYRNKIWLFNKEAAQSGTMTLWNSPDGINWTCTKIKDFFPSYSIGYAVAVYRNKLWLMGTDMSVDSPSFVFYSDDGVHWAQADTESYFTTRDDFAGLAYLDRLWILGGEKEWVTLSDVWYSK